MDNYYTCIQKSQNKNFKLPDPKVMMKMSRGVYSKITPNIHGIDITLLTWHNKVVNLVSTFAGTKTFLLANHTNC